MIDENHEKQIFISKIIDKIKSCKNKNIIEYTNFLDINKKSIALEVLKKEKFNNYIINNGEIEFDRNIIIMYPGKLDIKIVKEYYNKIVSFIKIENTKKLKYEHRVYLSGMMKLGIKREKFGDIIVNDDNANIVIFSDLAVYISNELKQLKRFKFCNINTFNIAELQIKEKEFEDINIIVHSLRLDNIVGEISKCSRTKVKEIIENGNVFVNSKCETKISKIIKQNDIITVRGKGKFVFNLIESKTKKDNFNLNLKRYK